MLEKIKIATDFLNGIFYGEYWYIAWGIVLLLFFLGIAKDIPKFIQSIKSIKNKNKGR